MACMFPEAQIYRERFLGLTKSLTAVKPPNEQEYGEDTVLVEAKNSSKIRRTI